MEVASHVAADTVKMFEDESGFKKTYERAIRQIFAPLTEHLP